MLFFCISSLFLLRASAVITTSGSTAPDDLPILQVKLGPPKRPLPEVEAEVSLLDHDRESLETDLMSHLNDVYEKTLSAAKAEIDNLVATTSRPSLRSSSSRKASAVAFLEEQSRGKAATSGPGSAFGVQLNILPAPPTDASVQSAMEKMESKRSREEKLLFAQASEEMQALTSIVLDALGAALAGRTTSLRSSSKRSSAGLGFVELASRRAGLPALANVRIAAADEAFPRVSDLVKDMESRRDKAESAERSAILELELKLLRAENEMIQHALSR